MKNVRFLGPNKAIQFGDGRRLERGGPPVRITDEQYASLEAQGERWQIEVVDSPTSQASNKDKPAGKPAESEPGEPAEEA